MVRFDEVQELISYRRLDNTREHIEPVENEKLYFAKLGKHEYVIHVYKGLISEIINFSEVSIATLA